MAANSTATRDAWHVANLPPKKPYRDKIVKRLDAVEEESPEVLQLYAKRVENIMRQQIVEQVLNPRP